MYPIWSIHLNSTEYIWDLVYADWIFCWGINPTPKEKEYLRYHTKQYLKGEEYLIAITLSSSLTC